MWSEISIKGQIRFLALGVAVPLAGLVVFMVTSDFRDTMEAARHEVDRAASVTAAAAREYAFEVDKIGSRLAASSGVRSLDPERCRGAVSPIADVLGKFSNLAVRRVGGEVVCSALPIADTADLDVSDHPWVQTAIATGRATFSPPVMDRARGMLLTSVTFPIEESTDEIVGILTVALGMARMQELVSGALPEGGLLTITDTAGVVLARSQDADEWVGRRLPRSADAEEVPDLSLPSGFNTTQGTDGIERLFAYRHVAGSPWVVWAGTPTDVIYAPVRAKLYPKVGLATLVMMFSTMIAWTLNRRIGSSLTGLVNEMRIAEAGDGALVPENGPAEISEVARQYNRMLSKRRGAEAEAAANADLHQLLMHASNDAVWDWDVRWDVVNANRQFFELFGGGPFEAMGGEDFWRSRIHPDDVDRAQTAWVGPLAEGQNKWTNEYRVRKADGTWADVLDRGYTLRDETGERIRLIGTIMDVTEQRRARRTVEKANERYESILNNAVFGIYVAGLDGRVVEANAALMAMLRIEKDTDTELNERDFYARPEERDAEVEAILGRQLAGPLEVTWRTVGGDALIVRLFRSLFTDQHGDVLLEVMAEDLTERRELEEQLRQAQKMEAIGRLAGGVAHDFNNRLTVIRGHAEMLRDEPSMDAEALESLAAILQSAEGAAKLTRELLAVSRKQVFRPRVLSIGEVVSNLRPMFGTLLGETVRIETDLPADLPNVSADPGQLEQILMNLLVNSRDAIPSGGMIRIETGHKSIGEDEAHTQAGLIPGDYVVLRVQDDGTGMDPEVLERVFEPFFTTKPVGMGTGLGLATVYGLAKQNDGFVGITSRVGEGTTVELLLPAVEGVAEAEPSPGGDTAPGGSGYTVLLVEDEEGVRSIVSRTLRRTGYRVLEAKDAQEALAIADRALDEIDLVLTDVVMPGMRGTDLADRLEERRSGLRVLFISGYSDRATAVDVDDHPLRGFLAKPFSPQQLGLAVSGLLGTPRSARKGPITRRPHPRAG